MLPISDEQPVQTHRTLCPMLGEASKIFKLNISSANVLSYSSIFYASR